MVEKDSTFLKATNLGQTPAQPGAASSIQPLNSEMILTDQFGHAVPSLQHVQTVGRTGPVLLQDFVFLNHIQSFTREVTPERRVHAKGHGAHGTFKVTDSNITNYCKAKLFNTVGKTTPIFCRMSSVNFERGFADTVRDPRGFAVKFYCQDQGEGILDWVFLNSPLFFTREPMKAPSVIHVNKRDVQSNLRKETFRRSMDVFWDWMSLNPESLHMIMWLFGDRGIPKSYRHMNGYGGHSFKTVNANGEIFYMRFKFKSHQGVENISDAEGFRIAGEDPDYHSRDLFEAIDRGEYPKWDVCYQVMSLEQAKNFRQKFGYEPFDITKVWYHSDFPEYKFGEMELNRNVKNYHAEVEQAAFHVGNLVSGFEPNPHDRLFQGRLFWYHDTQLHRLGSNHHLLPINNGSINGIDKAVMSNATMVRDGYMQASSNLGMALNYYPASSEKAPMDAEALNNTFVFDKHEEETVSGQLMRCDIYNEKTQFPFTLIHGTENCDDVDYMQPRLMWRKAFDEGARERFVTNVYNQIKFVTQEQILQRMLNQFNRADPELGKRLADKLGVQIKPSGIGEKNFLGKIGQGLGRGMDKMREIAAPVLGEQIAPIK